MATKTKTVRGRVNLAFKALAKLGYGTLIEKQGGRTAHALKRTFNLQGHKLKAFVDGGSAEVLDGRGNLEPGEILWIDFTGLRWLIVKSLHEAGLSTVSSKAKRNKNRIGVLPKIGLLKS